jgi:16S rRNA U516 pseudouridylate synthase RsuA-like enzyme
MITSLGTRVDARKDDILVDGKRVSVRSKQETMWVAIHKPKVSMQYTYYLLALRTAE